MENLAQLLETPKSRPSFQGNNGADEPMGNQQRKTVGLDFLAGLIVGEGSFVLSAHKIRGDRLRVKAQFYLQMNDEATMELVAAAFRTHGVPIWFGIDEKRGRIVIQVAGLKRMQRLLDLLLPHLTGQKQRAAETVAEFVVSRLGSHPHDRYSDRELALVQRLRSINGIGGKHVNRLTPETIARFRANRYKRNAA